MNHVNQKIIDAVIAKAEKVCPDSLALIGVYGSVCTGDEYEKSDLDLLILIQDEEATGNEDVFASFMNMCSFHGMLSDISSEVNIGTYNIMEEYNPDCLEDNVRIYDKYLEKYEEVYKKAGITVKRFSDVDKFAADYL
ncbi:MAG: hypothetical protein SO130_02585 [Agathobacter sp.]|nr:hypothetical protein [Agathobacter sp.]